MKKSILLLMIILLVLNSCVFSYILSSIKPIKLIVDQLLGEDTEYLIPENINPHVFSLRFSDMKKIKESELMVVIGPRFESWIDKIKTKNILYLQDYMYFQVEKNPHIWTDPHYSVYIAYVIKEKLKEIYPEKRALLDERYNDFVSKIEKATIDFSLKIKNIKIRGILELHPALYHFVNSFSLNPYYFVQSGHNESISLKKLKDIKEFVKENKINKIIVESNVENKLLKKLIKDLKLKEIPVDVLGSEAKDIFEFYDNLFNKIIAALR